MQLNKQMRRYRSSTEVAEHTTAMLSIMEVWHRERLRTVQTLAGARHCQQIWILTSRSSTSGDIDTTVGCYPFRMRTRVAIREQKNKEKEQETKRWTYRSYRHVYVL